MMALAVVTIVRALAIVTAAAVHHATIAIATTDQEADQEIGNTTDRRDAIAENAIVTTIATVSDRARHRATMIVIVAAAAVDRLVTVAMTAVTIAAMIVVMAAAMTDAEAAHAAAHRRHDHRRKMRHQRKKHHRRDRNHARQRRKRRIASDDRRQTTNKLTLNLSPCEFALVHGTYR